MGTVALTKLSIRVIGEELEPDEVSRLLGAAPDLAYRRGDPGYKGRGIRQQGMWMKQAPVAAPGDLDAQVRAVCDQLSGDFAVWRDLAGRYRIDAYVGLFLARSLEGISLAPATLQLLAERHIELGLDIYSGADDAD